MILPDWIEGHPDLAPRGELAAAAVREATRGWGKSDRPEPLVQYQNDPVGFAVDVLGIPEHTIRWKLNGGLYDGHEWDGTEEPLVTLAEWLAAGENVGVEAATGTSKSFTLAWLTLWWTGSWEGARTFTYAPTEDQLRLFMWMEMRKMFPRFKRRFPTAQLLDLRLRMIPGSDEWGAVGYAVRIRAGEESATGAQGVHAEHLLLITEETPGIDRSVMNAIAATATAPHNIQLSVGNPDHADDELHRWCLRDHVRHVRISGLDTPNHLSGEQIIPGVRGKVKNERDYEDFEGPSGRLYISRVRGVSPSEAADALIRRSWLERAAARYTDSLEHARLRQMGGKGLGVDVANSEGGDRAALAPWEGAVLLETNSYPCPDALQFSYRVQTRQALLAVEDRFVGVDSVGVGSNVINKGKEFGRRWQALNSGLVGKALGELDRELLQTRGVVVLDVAEFRNLRDLMWWIFRTDLMRDRIAIPPEREAPKLWRDLLTPQWTTRNGRVEVEPKEKIRERLGRSTDDGDAAIYGNYVRDRRIPKEPERTPSAWDPEVLEREAREGRRVHGPKPRRPKTPLTATEWIP